jgi:hypothetical protein
MVGGDLHLLRHAASPPRPSCAGMVDLSSYSHCRTRNAADRPRAPVAPVRHALFRWVCVGCVVVILHGIAGIAAEPPVHQSSPTDASAVETAPNEYAVKAVFLYSFGRYVEWPATAFESSGAPFVIGILGDDPFAGALDEIAAKKMIQGRRIVIRRFATLSDFKQPCHILFVSQSVPVAEREAVIAKTKSQPILLVGETPKFAEQGATANFFVEDNRVRFEINAEAARQSRLRMDAKLLSLGKPVSAAAAVQQTSTAAKPAADEESEQHKGE